MEANGKRRDGPAGALRPDQPARRLLPGGAPADAAFEWKKLEGKSVLADHGLQPLVMLRYVARVHGVDWQRIEVIDGGTPERMEAAFRAGRGDYVHLQGPAPQQLEKEGFGHVVASVGEAMPPVAFSSLAASRRFLGTAEARAFVRAYRQAREWARRKPTQAR